MKSYTVRSAAARFCRLMDTATSVQAFNYERAALIGFDENGRHVAIEAAQDILLEHLDEREMLAEVFRNAAAMTSPQWWLAWWLVRVEDETAVEAAKRAHVCTKTVQRCLPRVDLIVRNALDERQLLRTWQDRELQDDDDEPPRPRVEVYVDRVALADAKRCLRARREPRPPAPLHSHARL